MSFMTRHKAPTPPTTAERWAARSLPDRRGEAARHFSAHVHFGGGNAWLTSELRPEVVSAFLDAAAEHGLDAMRWPPEVRADIERQVAGGKFQSYGKLAEQRLRTLHAEHAAVVSDVLAKHGDDPGRWPVAAIDRVAQAEARIAAFERICSAARTTRINWEDTTSSKES